MPAFPHPWVDPDVAPMEDAALLRPETGPTLSFTVDFITPIVDDPATFGAIAAANALSDVYAMGGEPQAALAICGFPDDRVSTEVIARILRGGRDKAAEAGCAIVGGHTVLDPELKYGLCVIGVVEGDGALQQRHARVGDRLVLTKPIGSGVAAQAIKSNRLEATDVERVSEVLVTLNKGAKDAALVAGVHAATDVTGFGLLGHLHNLLLGCGSAARLRAADVPVFEFAPALAAEGVVPAGSGRNLEWVEPHVRFDPRLSDAERLLLCDAQTSGGLLLAVPPDAEANLLSELRKRRTPAAASIGEIVPGPPGSIEVT